MELTGFISRIQPVTVPVKKVVKGKDVIEQVPMTLVAIKFNACDGIKIVDRIEFHVPASHKVGDVGTKLAFKTAAPKKDKADAPGSDDKPGADANEA